MNFPNSDYKPAYSGDEETRLVTGKAEGSKTTTILPTRSLPTQDNLYADPTHTVMGAYAGADPLIPSAAQRPGAPFEPVVGWLVVINGPGRGEFRAVFAGQNSVGRGAGLRVILDFGDPKISREAHAFIIYDEQERKFFIKDAGRANLIRRNGTPILTPMELNHHDDISIGDTTLKFVAFCGPQFDWLDHDHAAKP